MYSGVVIVVPGTEIVVLLRCFSFQPITYGGGVRRERQKFANIFITQHRYCTTTYFMVKLNPAGVNGLHLCIGHFFLLACMYVLWSRIDTLWVFS